MGRQVGRRRGARALAIGLAVWLRVALAVQANGGAGWSRARRFMRAGYRLLRPPLARAIRFGYQTTRQRRARRIGVIVSAGLAMAALAISLPALRQHPFPLLYAYMLFASWYGDVLESACAMAVSVLAVVACDLLLPSFPALPLEEIVFVAASLWLLGVVQSLRRARQAAQKARQRAEDARHVAEEERARAERARLVAEEAVRVRDDFLTAASHDLRTPLTAILGRTEVIQMRLAAGGVVEAQWLRAQVDAQHRAATRMLATVGEITDAAQLQMGHVLSLSIQTLDVAALVREVAASAAATSRHQGRSPVVVEGATGVSIRGDAARLERVFQNIIGNAIKYSPDGATITVELSLREGDIVVAVRDRGVGIPCDELPRIFDRFYRASTSRGVAGSGIGLAGSKSIVEQHGGHIAVESTAGEGTCVEVSLPRIVEKGFCKADPSFLSTLEHSATG